MTPGYTEFLAAKQQHGSQSGFVPHWMPNGLFNFQQHLVDWAVRKGRAAIFADCGLGKTYMQLVWAENVVRETNRPVLVLTPLAVAHQTAREAEKFDIEAEVSRDGKFARKIVITNYERLQYFNSSDFGGVVCDESSILKNFDGRTKAAITEFMRMVPYRLPCTATAAPNDYFELGTTSEALGYLGYQDMLGMFFKQETAKDQLGWGRTTYRFRGHAEMPFWKWVCSWARAVRKPSDIGFSDDRFRLPELNEREHVVETGKARAGQLIPTPARSLAEQREESRITLRERCEAAAALAEQHSGATVLWCHTNAEADLLESMLPDALQVAGSMKDELKESRLLGFQAGEFRQLITKPKIGCFGLNWQHCHNVIYFPSNSYEQYYQSIRRCWRFGQARPVESHIIATEGQVGVMRNLQRKAQQADRMFDAITANVTAATNIDRSTVFQTQEEVPQWLCMNR